MFSYLEDFIYGATKYPCALFKPRVFLGSFGKEEKHINQRYFHNVLLSTGFRRTFWQLVFPGQTAGIIKKIPITETGENEYHIRFYKDGTIECELEVSRWSLKHWTGPRQHGKSGVEMLINVLENELSQLPEEKKIYLRGLFGVKQFTLECVRNAKSER